MIYARADMPGAAFPSDPPRRRAGRLALAATAIVALIVIAGLCVRRTPPAGPDTVTAPDAPVPHLVRRTEARDPLPYTTWAAPGADALLTIPALAPNGTTWAGDLRRNRLTGVHAASNTVTTVDLPVGSSSRIISVVATSPIHLWLTEEGRAAIGFFDLELRRYEEFPTPTRLSAPFGLARDRQGALWFTDLAGHQLGRFDPATEVFAEYPLPGEDLHPYLLAVADDGRIWFTVINRPVIGVLEPTSGQVALIEIPGLDEHEGTTGIAVDRDGTVWFGTLRGRLGRVTPSTLTVSILQSPARMVYGLAATAIGVVWLATTDALVYAFDPVSRRFCDVATGGGARWLAAAEDGAVWVSEGSGATNALGRISPARAAAPCGT